MEDRTVNRNTEVDRWFDTKRPANAETMQRVRTLILEADGRVSESIKWQTPTFSYKGNIASFQPAKRFVGLLFHRGSEIPGDYPHLLGDSRLTRTMHFADIAEAEALAPELQSAVRAWCDSRDRQ
jgi:hypothetical protein